MNRYAYALNNPIKYNDPSGHFAWIPVLVAGGALIGAGVSLFSQLHNGGTVNWGAVGTAAIVGSAIGLTIAVAAPLAVGLVGEGLTGAGLLTGSTTIFGAGVAATNASITLANAMVGTSSASTALPDSERATFDRGQADLTTFGEGDTLYRVHSPGRSYGNWWTTTPPQGELQWRIDQAVPPAWGNTAQNISTMKVPAGQTLTGWSGNAAYQGGIYVGGGNQVYLPSVPTQWVSTTGFIEYLKSLLR